MNRTVRATEPAEIINLTDAPMTLSLIQKLNKSFYQIVIVCFILIEKLLNFDIKFH